VRVIAGAARGRRLRVPPGERTRPTADRVKEALFSSLQARLPGAVVLDLYAGAGGLGLEALSRGAAAVTFVESDRRALEALHANIEVVGVPGAEVLGLDVRRALASDRLAGPFDLVLLDPPYRLGGEALGEVLGALVGRLAPGGRVVVERAARDGEPPWPPGLLPAAPRRYGDTTLHRADAGVTRT
jgi:16S rRNA (guanine966-N2)-methyltransferase